MSIVSTWYFFSFPFVEQNNFPCFSYLKRQLTNSNKSYCILLSCRTNLLPTEFELRTVSCGPSVFPRGFKVEAPSAGLKSVPKKRGSVNYGMDRENDVSTIFIMSLGSNTEQRFQFKQTCEFGGPCSKHGQLN